MLLSSHTLHQLLKDDKQDPVTEELYYFFVDVLNFYGEYSPSKPGRGDKLPDILFWKTQDKQNDINVLHLKKPYQFINNQISYHSLDNGRKEIEKKIKHWYESVDESFLDGTVSKYATESSIIKQLFVPLKDENWSILDIMVMSANHKLKNG